MRTLHTARYHKQSAVNNYVTHTGILIHYSALFNKNQLDALDMFRAFTLPIIMSYLLYIRQWYISCRFDDSFQAGSGWNWLVVIEKKFVTMHGHMKVKKKKLQCSSVGY